MAIDVEKGKPPWSFLSFPEILCNGVGGLDQLGHDHGGAADPQVVNVLHRLLVVEI